MELVLSNAEIVGPDRCFRGSVLLRDGAIADVSEGASRVGEDFEGDYLAPGLVDLHTDNLEKHYYPRPNIDWNPMSAAIIHDGFCLSLGVTTVFDSLSVGSFNPKESRKSDRLINLANGVTRAAESGALKGTHKLHWRCELSSGDLEAALAPLIDNPLTAVLSLMDHTPGQRQYRNLDRFIQSWLANDMTQKDIDERLAGSRERQAQNSDRNRRMVAAMAHERKLPMLAHDDETIAHVDAAADVGAVAAEFPVTVEAARRSRERGMAIIMGGPNLIRGGSYSGNVGAAELAEHDLLDIMASDYVPRSMIESPFALVQKFGWPLAKAFAAVTRNPAHVVGLTDRGVIAPGLRADLLRIRLVEGFPVLDGVWVAGRRAA